MAVTVFGCIGCTITAGGTRFECSDDELSGWDIHHSWLERRISEDTAVGIIAGGNVPGIFESERWADLRDSQREGDQLWTYHRPDEKWLRHTAPEEGIVLIRGCKQLGFVTTNLAAEDRLQ